MKFNTKTIIYVVLGIVVFLLLGVLLFLLLDTEEEVIVEPEEEVVYEFVGEVQDIDGNTYQTVQIGEQIWMAENLRTVSEHGQSWCYSGHDFYCERYGRLYNWEAVMAGSVEPGSQGVCPDGWYVPTDYDWYVLESFFANASCESSRLSWGCAPAGEIMKSEVWSESEESLFAVLPAGYIDRRGGSSHLNSYSYFWTSSKIGDGVWRRGFLDTQRSILRTTENPEYGYSLRCIKE